MVLRQPGALEPQSFAVLDLLGDLVDEAPRHRMFRPGQVGEKAKLHGRLLRVETLVSAVAQYIILCRASTLLETLTIFAPSQSPSPAKMCTSSRLSHVRGHHHRPSTHCEKVSVLIHWPQAYALLAGRYTRGVPSRRGPGRFPARCAPAGARL